MGAGAGSSVVHSVDEDVTFHADGPGPFRYKAADRALLQAEARRAWTATLEPALRQWLDVFRGERAPPVPLEPCVRRTEALLAGGGDALAAMLDYPQQSDKDDHAPPRKRRRVTETLQTTATT